MNIKNRLESLALEVISNPEKFTFQLGDLPPVNDYKTNIHNEFNRIFKKLDEKRNHCLYWFEVESISKGNQLQSSLDKRREKLLEKGRTVPVPNDNKDSKVLYVGIRRGGYRKKDNLSNLSGRIIIHLGYYDKGSTQGLQLVHWAKSIECKVTLNVVEFQDLPNDYLNIIEKLVAHELKPLCGRH